MWAVLSAKDKDMRRWNRDDFYQTGLEFVQSELELYESLNLPTHFERTLDFGSGLGRLSYAWADASDKVVGVDISKNMLRAAREAARRDNCEFVHNSKSHLKQFEDGSFDHVFTDIVLQHIPDRKIIKRYLFEFVRITKKNGIIRFQLPSALPVTLRYKYRRVLYHSLSPFGFSPGFLYTKLKLNPMKMNFIPVHEIVELLSERAALLSIREPQSPYTTYVYMKI